jgi:hypothetical protein
MLPLHPEPSSVCRPLQPSLQCSCSPRCSAAAALAPKRGSWLSNQPVNNGLCPFARLCQTGGGFRRDACVCRRRGCGQPKGGGKAPSSAASEARLVQFRAGDPQAIRRLEERCETSNCLFFSCTETELPRGDAGDAPRGSSVFTALLHPHRRRPLLRPLGRPLRAAQSRAENCVLDFAPQA